MSAVVFQFQAERIHTWTQGQFVHLAQLKVTTSVRYFRLAQIEEQPCDVVGVAFEQEVQPREGRPLA